jgi:hypothetical protein
MELYIDPLPRESDDQDRQNEQIKNLRDSVIYYRAQITLWKKLAGLEFVMLIILVLSRLL